jgi:hypothetical protein
LNAVNGTANATFNGILNTSGTLTRAMGTDSPLDCLAKSFADVRVGAAFADPDAVLVHPNTLSALRRQKDAGRPDEPDRVWPAVDRRPGQ